MERAEATPNWLSLPQELLENIFHRLPFATLRHAKQVCREWGRVLHSASFTSSYRSTAKVVQTRMPDRTLVEVIDSDDNVLRVRRDRNVPFGKLACSRTGLLTCFHHAEDTVLVSNLFSNMCESVLAPPLPAGEDSYVGDCLAVFGFGDGRYKLVYWDCLGDLSTLESGEQEWTDREDLGRTRAWPDPVVIGNSLFRVNYEDGMLLEYNAFGEGKVTALKRNDNEKLHLAAEVDGIRELVAWENRLYLLLVLEEEEQKMRLWMVSMADGVCTLVMEQERDEFVGAVSHVEIDDGKLVILYRDFDRDDACLRLICDMETKRVESFSHRPEPFQTCITVPVTLY